MNFILDQEEKVMQLEEYMDVIGSDFMELSLEVVGKLKEEIRMEKNRVKKIEKITRYPDTEDLEPLNDCKFSKTLTKKASFHTPKIISPKSLYVKHVRIIFPNPPLIRESTFGFKPSTKNNRNIKSRHDAKNLNPQSTPQVLLSFEEYTPPVTYLEEVQETLGTPIEVEPLDETQLEDLGLNTCIHNTPFSSREVLSFDGLEPQLLLNSPSLDVSLGDVIGPEPPIKLHSPDSSRMKLVDYLTTQTPPSPHVANSHPKSVYSYYNPGIDDPKRHYGFKPGLLGKSISLGVDISNWELFDDDWGLESKEVSPLGEEISLFDRPNVVERGRILEAHRLESILQQKISQRMAPSHHDGRKAHLLEDKQIPSVGVFDEVFSIWKEFGGNTRDLGSFGKETDKTMNLHQHLLRISTQKLEMASQITSDAVTTHLKTASQDLQTASDWGTFQGNTLAEKGMENGAPLPFSLSPGKTDGPRFYYDLFTLKIRGERGGDSFTVMGDNLIEELKTQTTLHLPYSPNHTKHTFLKLRINSELHQIPGTKQQFKMAGLLFRMFRVVRIEVRGTMQGVQVQLVMGELRTKLGMQIHVKQGRLSVTTATMLLMQAQENGVALDEEQLLFIAGGQDNVVDEDVDEQPVQDLALNVDNLFNLIIVMLLILMLMRLPLCRPCSWQIYHPHIQFMMKPYSLTTTLVLHVSILFHSCFVLSTQNIIPNIDLNADYTSDNHMITYDQYVKDNAESVVQSNVSSVPNDAYMMINNEMHEQTAQSVSTYKQNKVVNVSLTAELATYKDKLNCMRDGPSLN
ncbi:hypothetical protein Tco_0233378 [Tanacetum coccineum]